MTPEEQNEMMTNLQAMSESRPIALVLNGSVTVCGCKSSAVNSG
jgi:hypothetical protein